jgi:hypothetical protein
MRSASSGVGISPVLAATEPSSITCDTISMPERLLDQRLGHHADATRAAVSRALARSRIGRASVCPYFCMPASRRARPRPGQRRVAGLRGQLLRVTGSAAITVCHFGHSELPIRIATGTTSVTHAEYRR